MVSLGGIVKLPIVDTHFPFGDSPSGYELIFLMLTMIITPF